MTFLAVPTVCVYALVRLGWPSFPLFSGLKLPPLPVQLSCSVWGDEKSPSRDFHQQLATVRVNRPKYCEPGRGLWDVTEGVVMPRMTWVCWIIFVLSFVTMQEVTATSRHYVDRLFDPDPQNVLQGVMWVNNHVSFLVRKRSALWYSSPCWIFWVLKMRLSLEEV